MEVITAALVAACSNQPLEPWAPAKSATLSEEFRHIAETHAVADICSAIAATMYGCESVCSSPIGSGRPAYARCR